MTSSSTLLLRRKTEMRGIGFCGAHRTGKTTLAIQVAEKLNVPFVQTSVSSVFARLGLSPSETLDPTSRLMVQEATLLDAISKWDCQVGLFCTDRTPVDFIAYTLSNIKQEDYTADLNRQVESYILRCKAAIRDHFSYLVEVKPGIPIVNAEGKACMMPSYCNTISYMVSGCLSDITTPQITIPKNILSIDERTNYVLQRIAK